MEDWQEGEVGKNRKWTKNLTSLKIKEKKNTNQEGQFTKKRFKEK